MEPPQRATQRWALGLEYRGTDFCGWQRQSAQPSVQQALELALSQIAQTETTVIAAGRTDTGVHASLQVVHFDTAIAREPTAWVRGGNQFLPDDVAIRWAAPVDEQFHARFAARSRRYVYLLTSAPQRPGLHAGRVGWTHWPLDLARIEAALPALWGTHDFTSFRAAECQAKSPIKTLTRAEVRQSGNLFIFDFEASAFLHHMVRNLVGTLVHIGKGAQVPGWVDELLLARDRKQAAPTFSPAGLYFRGPVYEPHWGLPDPADDFLDGVFA